MGTLAPREERPWWRDAVTYQIYPRSFADANGDGIGDVEGIRSRLPYLSSLGIDAIWISPWYPSPQHDHGYDVSNYMEIEPDYGTLTDAERLIKEAHEMGMRIIVDIVPNHTSDQHAWFQAALKAAPGSKERARYMFKDGKGENGELPPNNWSAVFGGSAWQRITEADGKLGQWYLHLFAIEQPDLNWENPDVASDFEETLRFWLDLGADGFRIDVAHGLAKENISIDHHDPQGLSDALRLDNNMSAEERGELLASVPFFDRDGVHSVYRNWRKLFDSYNRDVMAVAEAWVHPPERATRYVRSDELHQVFNFDLLDAPFKADFLYDVVTRSIDLMDSVGALPTWALSNHDSPRVASRIGEVQARALALFVLALPGSCYVFAGQELGLPDGEIPDSSRQDPIYIRTKGVQKGRDGARVPLPWNGDTAPFGFTTGKPWLPLTDKWKELTVEKQSVDPKSTLNLYRTALKLRADHLIDQGSITWLESPEHGSKSDSLLAVRRGNVSIYMNLSDSAAEVEITGKLLIVSAGIVDSRDGKVTIPPVSTIWVHH